MGEATAKQFTSGVVFGKFYPLTKGHEYLIGTAVSTCGTVTICISHRPSETIPVSVRAKWATRLFPTTRVVVLDDSLPYFPEECSTPHEFYTIWERVLCDACGHRPQACFTSEPSYDPFVTGYLRARHIVVDPERRQVPISGTKVRSDPFKYWEYLSPVVRASFVTTVCVYGPESCGKTTLCQQLAEHYRTAWQPEFAREYLGERHCEYADMQIIAEGHLREREWFLQRANRLLFVDTDTITTKIFSEHYYGQCPPRVEEIIELPENRNSFYLLLRPDVPWVPDTSRDLGDEQVRWAMYGIHERHLIERDLPHVAIGGDWQARFSQAVHAVDRFLLR